MCDSLVMLIVVVRVFDSQPKGSGTAEFTAYLASYNHDNHDPYLLVNVMTWIHCQSLWIKVSKKVDFRWIVTLFYELLSLVELIHRRSPKYKYPKRVQSSISPKQTNHRASLCYFVYVCIPSPLISHYTALYVHTHTHTQLFLINSNHCAPVPQPSHRLRD